MSATEEKLRAKIVDHEVLQSAGLVTYVIDVWRGDREDPATAVERYLGVWNSDDLVTEDDEAITPTISIRTGYSYRGGDYGQKPEAKFWQKLEVIKAADKEAEQFKGHTEHMMNEGGYSYGEMATQKRKYQAFMRALDVLAIDEGNEEAWAMVEEYREYQALKHEK